MALDSNLAHILVPVLCNGFSGVDEGAVQIAEQPRKAMHFRRGRKVVYAGH